MRPYSQALDRTFDVILSVFYSIAFITSGLRLYRRQAVGCLWWDDVFLFFAAVGSVWVFVLYWFKLAPTGSAVTSPSNERKQFWMVLIVSWVTLWCTRFSLALGTAQLFKPQNLAHRLTVWVTGFFICIFTGLVLATIIYCSLKASWDNTSGSPNTVTVILGTMPSSLNYLTVAVGLTADALLIVIPVVALWNLKAPPPFRRMLIAVFASRVLITCSTTALLVLQDLPESWEPLKTSIRFCVGYLETSISVIVCNLVVIVSYIYRLIYGQRITGSALEVTTIYPNAPSNHESRKPGTWRNWRPSRRGTSVFNSHSTISINTPDRISLTVPGTESDFMQSFRGSSLIGLDSQTGNEVGQHTQSSNVVYVEGIPRIL